MNELSKKVSDEYKITVTLAQLKSLIKDSENDIDLVLEMAQIGRMSNPLWYLWIWPNDGGNIPHFHISDVPPTRRGGSFHCAIKLKEAEYFKHGSYTDEITSVKRRKELVDFLQSKTDLGITMWQFALFTWNQNNSEAKVDVNLEIPDYTKLG